MKKPNKTLKLLLILSSINCTIQLPSAHAEKSLSADEIKTIREVIQQQKDEEAIEQLTPEQREERQAIIDAEVTANFKKRIQMRPSDVAAIPPECDEWLKLYQQTGWQKAQQGIKATCP